MYTALSVDKYEIFKAYICMYNILRRERRQDLSICWRKTNVNSGRLTQQLVNEYVLFM